jgi:glyoxylase-like metal-dependent hydrolase (beta-lactamase superfamily II)
MLPGGIQVIERGWLSSNLVLIHGTQPAVVDSGYASHASQTLALVQTGLGHSAPHWLLNTHLHSDHCGGNATLQAHYAPLHTLIPPGQAGAVHTWDEQALGFAATGQHCPRFAFDGVLSPGLQLPLGDQTWQVWAAPGHDPHAVMLWQAHSRVLVTGDALWGNGFGVVFPEIDGAGAFDEVAATLELIARLAPKVVVPGHGPAFADVADALERAHSRLNQFVRNPASHHRYAAKVLLKFKLLDARQLSWSALLGWANSAWLLQTLQQKMAPGSSFEAWLRQLIGELVASGAAAINDSGVENR